MEIKTPLLINMFDFYGKDIPLQIFGAAKKKSLFGAVMGFLSLLSIGAITIYFLTTLFSRDTKQIITNHSYSRTPSANLNNLPLMLTLTDTLGRFVPPEAGIWEVKADLFEMKWAEGGGVENSHNLIPLRKCTKEDAAGYPIPDSFLSVSLCVPFGKNNITLKSYFDDTVNGWSSFYFYLTKCNSKTNTKCQNSSVIEQTMERGYFSISTFASIVDNDDTTNPAKPFFSSTTLSTSNSLYKQMEVFLTQNLYTDDVGFVFESLVDHNFFVMGEVKYDYSLSPPFGLASLLGDSTIVAAINLQNSKFVAITKRTFLKAQAVLANIGGVYKFVMVIAQLMTQIVTRKSVFIQIGNSVFNYGESILPVRNDIRSRSSVLRIARKAENVVPVSENNQQKEEISAMENKGLKSLVSPEIIRNSEMNSSRSPTLKLNLWELLCISCCISNKRVVNQYDFTERTILEKISIHSLIKDSYKLENLTKLTLNAEQYQKLGERPHMPIEEMI